MRKILSGLCATTLAASFAIASVVPINAAPVVVPKAPVAQSDVIQVQSRGREVMEERLLRRNFRGDRRDFRRDARQDRSEFRQDRRDFRRSIRRDRDDRYGWYRGYRGYRDYRPGYRRYNDFWFPAAAFITGAIIGSAIDDSPSGAMTAGGLIAPTTTPISHIMARAASAFRPIADR